MRAQSSLHTNFPSANGTIIVSISTSKHIVLISQRERETEWGRWAQLLRSKLQNDAT